MNLYTMTVTIFLVLDALGNIPAYLSILNHVDPARHFRIILRESIFALITLTVFLFAGKYIMAGLGLSEQALGITGGIVLFIIAIRLIFPRRQAKGSWAHKWTIFSSHGHSAFCGAGHNGRDIITGRQGKWTYRFCFYCTVACLGGQHDFAARQHTAQ